MYNIPEVDINLYDYPLPQEKIAKYPLPKRDESKLLVLKNGHIQQSIFKEIPGFLPSNSLLVFNNTKVVRARVNFFKSTGARIEIFCLEPANNKVDIQLAFQQSGQVDWRCLVGNAKKWKTGKLFLEIDINQTRVKVGAEIISKLQDSFIIRFSWQPGEFSFSEVLESSGNIPLPPYIKREAEKQDIERYQTVYAQHKGSVAAPTAGLHFTEDVLERLHEKSIDSAQVSLHVGAGTFKPVSAENISEHQMHTEKISVSKNTLEKLKQHHTIIPVGTTSVRTLESIYWFGVRLFHETTTFQELQIEQWTPYKHYDRLLDKNEAIDLVLEWMAKKGLENITGATRLMIVPGYQFMFAKCMITNFHQPRSTLLLLVSAFIGEKWKQAYQFALENHFRFLSYGDSCLFLP